MGGGDLDPRFYPSLFFYLCFLGDVIYVLGLYLFEKIQHLRQAWDLYLADPTAFYMIGRGLNAVLGALSIPLLYVAVRNTLKDKMAASLAALFLAVSFLHVEYSQYALLDVPLTFFVLASFFFAQRALESGALLQFAWTGLFCGLATSTKYNGLATLLWGFLASFLAPWRWKTAGRQQAVLFAAFLGGFTLGTPYWLFKIDTFVKKASFMWTVYKAGGVGELGYDVQWNWLHYLGTVLPYGVGWPMLAMGFLGLTALILSRKPAALLLAVFALAYFCVAGASSLRAARYMLPLLPFLFAAAAYLICSWSRRLCSSNRIQQRFCVLILSAVVLTPNLISLTSYLRLKTQADTRTQALHWIRENVPAGSKVLQSFFGITFVPKNEKFDLDRLDSALFDTRLFYKSSLKPLAEYRKAGYRYLMMDEWQMGLVRGSSQESPVFRENLQKYEQFLRELESTATLLVEFSPYRDPKGERMEQSEYDWENVQLPARRMGGMKSLGPTLRVYKL